MLVPIQSVPTRWNTTLAEIERGIELHPVCAFLVDLLMSLC